MYHMIGHMICLSSSRSARREVEEWQSWFEHGEDEVYGSYQRSIYGSSQRVQLHVSFISQFR